MGELTLGEQYINMRSLVRVAHKGQKYGEVDYYKKHIKEVVSETEVLFDQLIVSKLPSVGESTLESIRLTLIIVALGHDLIEDTSYTIEDLTQMGFDKGVVNAIHAITKRQDQSRKEYLREVKQNKLALIVKKADTMVNLRNSYLEGNYTRIRKYSEQLTYLFKEV